MYAVAGLLKGVGIYLTDLTTYAVDLHDYKYNGFEPGFSKYSRREDLPADLLRETLNAENEYFPKYALKELMERVEKVLQDSGSA